MRAAALNLALRLRGFRSTSSSEGVITRRFSSFNRKSPVYKAALEMGKALKTIFLCMYFTEPRLRREIHDALNIVEAWNSCIQFISYGRKTELPTNDPVMQEVILLCIMLLQNALVLVNTLLVDRVVEEKELASSLTQADKRALTPLFTQNVNPYGDFELDLERPSILERRRPEEDLLLDLAEKRAAKLVRKGEKR